MNIVAYFVVGAVAFVILGIFLLALIKRRAGGVTRAPLLEDFTKAHKA